MLTTSSRPPEELVTRALLVGSALVSGAIVAGIVAFLVHEASSVLLEGGWRRFLLPTTWRPSDGLFGLWPMALSTLATAAGAMLLAIPIGLSAAVLVRYVATPVTAKALRSLMALLAGVPSVVYGLWGLTVLVPLVGNLTAVGTNLLTAIIVLAIMVGPTVVLATDAALGTVDPALIRAGLGLGLSQRAVVLKIAFPVAARPVAGGLVLSLMRAVGETMAVMMVAGNVANFPRSLTEPVRLLTSNIALEMAYAMGDHRAALFVSGLGLVFVVFLFSSGAWVLRREPKEALDG